MSVFIEEQPKTESEAYQNLLDAIQRNINRTLSEDELHEAARNLIDFYKTVMEMHRQMQERNAHEEYR